ncbi:MAG: MobF family relaxase [Pseudomonadota bacterium]
MIRMIQCQTSNQAKKYFADSLSKSEYYLDDQEMSGHFHGDVARRLGLEDQVITREVFDQLCDNINPLTGDSLTPRTRDDRTVGYDINFHCPKSVSLLHTLGNDDRILPAFQQAVHETMLDIERDMQTRVRLNGKDEDRHTGSLIWADFTHQTARPTQKNKAGDAHLHTHIFTFNQTWDDVEGRFKAGQFRDIKRDMPYYQARCDKRLADTLQGLGYDIRKTYSAFEISSVSQQAIDHFSKRTDEIGRFAIEHNITDKAELDQLGARTRSRKQKGWSMQDLKTHWRNQLEREKISLFDPKHTAPRNSQIMQGRTCVDKALTHIFERASVMPERKILSQAYRHAIGQGQVSLKEIQKTFNTDSRIYHVYENGRKLCTTLTVQKEERKMVDVARSMRGNKKPLCFNMEGVDTKGLNDEQTNAIRHVLTSGDQVTMIKGSAGTGKTTLMSKAVKAIEQNHKRVGVFAPSASASRDVLRKEGFEEADTVARLIKDKTMQRRFANQVIWVDEAGLLGTGEMLSLLEIAQQQNARLVLSGDTRQHASVKRGDAMRILNKVAKIPFASTKRIYRQKVKEYREAIEALSEGDIRKGFDRLDKMGAVKELKGDDLTQQLAVDYLETVKAKKSALIISPTNKQAETVTRHIRELCKKEKIIGKRDKEFTRTSNLYWTETQKQDQRNYERGMIIQSHQNMSNIKKGEKLTVADLGKNDLIVQNSKGIKVTLPLDRAGHFDVYKQDTIELAVGDHLRITKNGQDVNKQRLDNGKLLTIKRFNKDGSITAQHGIQKGAKEYRLPKGFSNLDHAYCLTSHSSQGKTVDQVFIAQPADTFPATSDKQFYVSVSRGREKVTIYTDDKAALLDHAMKGGDRLSALELNQKIIQRKIQEFEMNKNDIVKSTKYKTREPEI